MGNSRESDINRAERRLDAVRADGAKTEAECESLVRSHIDSTSAKLTQAEKHTILGPLSEFRSVLKDHFEAVETYRSKLQDSSVELVTSVRNSRMMLTSETKSVADSIAYMTMAIQDAQKVISAEWLLTVLHALEKIAVLAENPKVLRALVALAGDNKPLALRPGGKKPKEG